MLLDLVVLRGKYPTNRVCCLANRDSRKATGCRYCVSSEGTFRIQNCFQGTSIRQGSNKSTKLSHRYSKRHQKCKYLTFGSSSWDSSLMKSSFRKGTTVNIRHKQTGCVRVDSKHCFKRVRMNKTLSVWIKHVIVEWAKIIVWFSQCKHYNLRLRADSFLSDHRCDFPLQDSLLLFLHFYNTWNFQEFWSL